MTSNSFERMKIVLSMTNPFDYMGFIKICLEKNILPLSVNEYAMKVGYIEMANIEYPELPIEEGYLKIVEESNRQPFQEPHQIINSLIGCGSCGGGKVR